jgi:hypothetical protein
MLTHGFTPLDILKGTIIPIPKIKGTNKSENYRGITLGSMICEILESVLLHQYKEHLSSCELQFGFKSKSSTTTCNFMVQETISYYNTHGNAVYGLLLDASKAFDRLEFCALFEKLRNRNICPLILKLILFMYCNQNLVAKWGEAT